MNKYSTIHDVAEEANVSVTSVSRVINRIRVNNSIQIRVEDAIEKLCFVPNTLQRMRARCGKGIKKARDIYGKVKKRN